MKHVMPRLVAATGAVILWAYARACRERNATQRRLARANLLRSMTTGKPMVIRPGYERVIERVETELTALLPTGQSAKFDLTPVLRHGKAKPGSRFDWSKFSPEAVARYDEISRSVIADLDKVDRWAR